MYLTDKMQSIGDTKKIIVDKSLGVELIDNDKYLEINTEAEKIFKVIKVLKEDTKLLFDQLIDVTAIDYPSREKRFDMIYLLISSTPRNLSTIIFFVSPMLCILSVKYIFSFYFLTTTCQVKSHRPQRSRSSPSY